MSIKPNNATTYKFAELIDYYEVCNRAEGKSPKTLSWYSANLRHFHSYLQSRHIPDEIYRIDTRLLREYVLYLLKRNSYQDHPYTPTKKTPLSTATIHGHVRTLRAFFNWLTKEEFIQQNPTIGLKPPKLSHKVVTVLSDEEIRTIINTFNPKQPSDARNQTIFMMLLDAGLRIGEIIRLKIPATVPWYELTCHSKFNDISTKGKTLVTLQGEQLYIVTGWVQEEFEKTYYPQLQQIISSFGIITQPLP